MQSGQIRLNKVTREWVIYAPSRRKRPQDFQQSHRPKKSLAIRDAKCPFCPGNEHISESIVLEIPNQNHDGWQTRILSNKFPALTPNENTRRWMDRIYLAMPGYGQHEVIVESPNHNDDIANMPIEAVEMVIETYHKRYIELMAWHENMMGIIFRNHGANAGASSPENSNHAIE